MIYNLLLSNNIKMNIPGTIYTLLSLSGDETHLRSGSLYSSNPDFSLNNQEVISWRYCPVIITSVPFLIDYK